MRTKTDQLAAGVLSTALETIGHVDLTPEPIAGLQATEMWFQPDPSRASRAKRARLGALGRMTRSACLIEPFRETPSLNRIRDSIGKQLALDRAQRVALTRELAERKNLPPGWLSDPDGPVASKLLRYRTPPALWLISAGRPRTLLHGTTMKPMRGWPRGFWRSELPMDAVRLIVLSDLPVNRDTLLLRLLSRGLTFARAVRQLSTLASTDWTWRIASAPLVALHRHWQRAQAEPAPPDAHPDAHPDEEQDMSDILKQLDVIYARWEREMLQRGAEQGRIDALRDTLETQLEKRFGPLSPAVQKRLQRARATTLARWLKYLPDADSAEAVLRR
ncbi:MAG: hypothetical protein Tsb0020_16410 [Haliangiales bacterium]